MEYLASPMWLQLEIMNRKKKVSGDKRTEQKNRLDSMFRGNVLNTIDRAAVRYDKYGFQPTAKKVRNLKKQIKSLIGGL